MAKMTKSQLMTVLAEKTGLSKKDVVNFMDILVKLAYKEVKTGGEFVLPGFGKIVVKFRLAKAAKEAVL